MAAGNEVAALFPEIWAASVADLSQDLSDPGLARSCSVESVELGCSHWETNCCIHADDGCHSST